MTEITGKKIIVTGGAGFIGSHLVDSLLQKGNKVVVIDDLSTGSVNNLDKNAEFIEAGTTDFNVVEKVFARVKPEFVIHLAANTNVPKSVIDPIYDFRTLEGALNVIEISKLHNINKLIYISSGFIYGNTKSRPIRETEPFIPLSPYGITKKSIEYYLMFYNKAYGLCSSVLRPATIYGPRQTNGAMADYIHKLSNGKQAEIYGDGSKTRDYVYISDAITAILHVLNNEEVNSGVPVYNLGSGIETPILDIYEKIADLLGVDACPIYKKDRVGELQYYSLDSSKLKKKFNWTPKTTLSEGLEKLLKHNGLI